MTQEFHISVTPVGGDQYLVQTTCRERGVPVAQEQVSWAVEAWLAQAKVLMNDPLLGLLRGDLPSLLSDRALPSHPASRQTANLVAFGQTLYDALFQGTVRDSWMAARGVAQHSQEILRLRLGLKDPRLSRLPWEVLYEGDRPIAAGTDVIFSRYHSSFTAHNPSDSPLIPKAYPLRILMVLAAPSDQEALALKQEALHLQTELSAGLSNDQGAEVELTILEQPGREQLTEKLEHQHYHVFHYAGHSDLGVGGGNLSLVNPRTGLVETLNGDDLAGLLVNNGIHLAVLNSCRGVHSATSDQGSESSLAEALVKRGIPAVLAMAERIPDDVALNLSRLFYRNLKQSHSIDLSLNRARQGLISSYSSDQLYWALPILYLHPQFDGYVLPVSDRRDRLTDLLVESAIPDSNSEAGTVQLEVDSLALAGVEVDFDNFDAAASLFDPDDLEFDDLEYEADQETVAQLVSQLSQGPPIGSVDQLPLAASSEESLLPDRASRPNYTLLPNQIYDTPSEVSVGICTSVVATSAVAPSAAGNVEMYLELERMLAEAGKLTDAIAIGNRAIQARPSDPKAYHNLAIALLQTGYLSEAIAALQQAIQLDPESAKSHNQLGLALYQQGNFAQAIQAYNQAIQLDPQAKEAHQNLEIALQRQTTMDREPVPPARSLLEIPAEAAPPLPKPGRSRRPLIWAIAAVLGGMALLGAGLMRGINLSRPTLEPLKTSVDRSPSDLNQLSTKTVAALATEQLNQGNIPAAQKSIEALLNRTALAEASAVLTPSLTKFPKDPIVNFLMGRLTWQLIRTGNKDYSLQDVRRYWETAAQQQSPNSLQLNALGSLYYTQGNFDQAQRSWQRSLELLGEDGTGSGPKSSNAPVSQDLLTASLGMALTYLKSAEAQSPPSRTILLSKAIELRQKVLTLDPVNSQPDAVLKNWIWLETTVQDWRSLLATKPPA